MRGEHPSYEHVSVSEAGSSPHARGTLRPAQHDHRRGGIIPACAGNTSSRKRRARWRRDHPRMRGEHQHDRHGADVRTGSSPHARGTQRNDLEAVRKLGIIPACAGNTLHRTARPESCGDHPRMRGEHLHPIIDLLIIVGSSPHARGTLRAMLPENRKQGIIPACAGNTLVCLRLKLGNRDHPRMRGEHLRAGRERPAGPGSSPHARGTRFPVGWRHAGVGIIPACAGNTHRIRKPTCRHVDHPRMRGEHKA